MNTAASRRAMPRNKNGRVRDNQRQRVYDAEHTAACAHGTGWKQTIANADLQQYVTDVLARASVQSRWGQRRIVVGLTHGGGRASHYGDEITLGVSARNPWVILHEVAHCLTPNDCASHGPEFVGVLLFLIQTVMGKAEADTLRAEFRRLKVRKTNTAIPAPTRRVVTKAAKKVAAQARTNRPLSDSELRQAADVIRRAAKQGLLGDATKKPRVHALATARLLEGAQK